MNLRSSFTALVLGVTLLVLALPGVAMASEVRSGTAATVAPGETLDEDLFATGLCSQNAACLLHFTAFLAAPMS